MKKMNIEIVYVNLDNRSYQILIEPGCLKKIASLIKPFELGSKIAVVSNPTVNSLYGDTVIRSLTDNGFSPFLFLIGDGEVYKTLDTVNTLYNNFVDSSLDRRCGCIALGGGVVGDVAGFAAATYLRGIPLIMVPTTLIAQVDSSVGGKVGVNLPKGKNLVGSFYQPKIVIIDPWVLVTLPIRELRAGLAEVIKYGVIWDYSFFNYLEENIDKILSLDEKPLTYVISRCCSIKAEIVSKDEREEKGLRTILNFGHTIGHAIETLTSYENYRHGEAIAIGMIIACKLACAMNIFDPSEYQRIEKLIQVVGLPTSLPALDVEMLINSLFVDKKVREGKIRMVLPEKIGKVKVYDEISIPLLKQVLYN